MLWKVFLFSLYKLLGSIDFQPQGVLHEKFCTLPYQDDYPLNLTCTYTSHNRTIYSPINCNSTICECEVHNKGFSQICVYNSANSTHYFTRTCENFRRSCFLLLNPYGPTVECSDSYKRCDMMTTVALSRFANGSPSYNPPSCEPVIAPAKDGCNSTITNCKSVTTYKFGRSPLVTKTSCSMSCQAGHTSCTNYTKICKGKMTSWKLPSHFSHSHQTCNVVTSKCVARRHAEWIPFLRKVKPTLRHSHGETGRAVIFETLDCGITINLSQSLNSCKQRINQNMQYKGDCLLHGLELLEFMVIAIFQANTTLSKVVSWMEHEWYHAVGNLCNFDCFHVLVREMRFCMEDLPLQNILPGMTTTQFEQFLFSTSELICSSTPDHKKKETSCVIYMDESNKLTAEILRNLSKPCKLELLDETTCTMECTDYLEKYILPRNSNPGCCLGVVRKYERENGKWLNLLSSELMKRNFLNRLVDHCLPELEIKTCAETVAMHPIVVAVLVILVIFSSVLLGGVVSFVVIFYRQQEHEKLKYKKTFLTDFLNMKSS